ncbi:MAG TPA: YjbE family putative metal transport protein [Stellaceae bacterium]|nr:YjbE family putative metal transport protein [Stellaceae bacterium]
MIALDQLTALAQVVLVDLTLAGDNAIVLGILAGGLRGEDRNRALTYGVLAAAAMRIVLAIVATRLLAIIGLTLAGGILLLWVAWKMAREIAGERHAGVTPQAEAPAGAPARIRRVMWRIAVADLTMSLDNVLAVAGTARDRMWVLVIGLVLSVALMGGASLIVAKLMQRAPWLAWLGIAIVAYVAVSMIIEGSRAVGARFA